MTILIIICAAIAFFIIGMQVQSYLVCRTLGRYQKNLAKAAQKKLYDEMFCDNTEDK